MRRTETTIAALVFAIVFAIYARTSAPGLGTVDSGELTTVAATLGIAHPTGYPLYALLGRVWLLLTPGSPDRAMVLFSVLAGALTGAVLAAGAYRLLRQHTQAAPALAALSAGLLALSWALTSVAWESVAFAEVYPLSSLGTAILLYLAILADTAPPDSSFRLALLAAFVWGLAFGNHLTIIWQFPLVLFILSRGRSWIASIRLLPFSAAAFALGCSLILFLPIRSSLEPSLDWGDPETWTNLLRHMSAWQYRVWMFTGDIKSQVLKLLSYVAALPPLWGWPLIVLSAAGAIGALIWRRWLAVAAFLAWLISALYNLNYDIPDINTYEIVPFPDIFLLALFGLLAVYAIVPLLQRVAVLRAAFFLLFCGLPAVLGFAANHQRADVSGARFASAFARELLRTVDSNAVILHGNWDIQSPAIYEQQLNRYRRDVAIFDLNLLQRSWYFPSQRRDHPSLCEPCQADYERFLAAVRPFEADQPVDGAQIEDAYTRMTNCVVQQARAQGRPVYLRDLASVNHPGVGVGLARIPGAYFDLLSDSGVAQSLLEFANIDTTHSMRDPHVRVCLREAVNSTIHRGSYLASIGDSTAALELAHIVSNFAPGLSAVSNFRRQLGLPPLVDSAK
ncbi:DUF2723 domain-containing protein [candidate division KSB1 bacterium]|nr:DUF2723 domain-containing protein [candidate division KSB1 bacterium]